MADDTELLERVQLRLSLCDTDEKFEDALARLLPGLLLKMGVTASKAAGMAVLSHINTVLKSRPALKLPVDALLEQLADPAVDGGVKPFSRMYLEMALPRTDAAARPDLARRLLLAARSCFHGNSKISEALMMFAIPWLGQLRLPAGAGERPAAIGVDDAEFAAAFTLLLRDFLLLASGAKQMTLAAATALANAAAAAANTAPAQPKAPGGLSWSVVSTFVKPDGSVFGISSREQMIEVKLAILNLLGQPGLFPSALVLPPLFASLGDTADKVVDTADMMVKHHCTRETLNESGVALGLVALFLGSQAAAGVAAEHMRSPASPALRLALMAHILRSERLAALYPAALQITFSCLFDATTPKLRTAGLNFMHRCFELAPASTLKTLLPVYMSAALMKLLDNPYETIPSTVPAANATAAVPIAQDAAAAAAAAMPGADPVAAVAVAAAAAAVVGALLLAAAEAPSAAPSCPC
eukprot:m.124536 g.124536  ORF g.124536 m.124536 type:complete len:470 (+) comp16295_c0_seq3:69-1478(+)